MDNDGVHICKHGAFLILHHQVVLPQGHAVGQGVAEQRQGAGSAWLPALAGQWCREGTQGFVTQPCGHRGNRLQEWGWGGRDTPY